MFYGRHFHLYTAVAYFGPGFTFMNMHVLQIVSIRDHEIERIYHL